MPHLQKARETRTAQAGLLDYGETRKLLDMHGIPLARGFYCTSGGEVMRKSKSMPSPWVLKVVGKNIFHKTERKLIALDLHNFEQLYHAVSRLAENAGKTGLREGEWGFLLQGELKGVELIIGGKTDAVFGKTVLFGSGGVAVELFKDFSTRVCPIAREDALQMISETKASVYLNGGGFRGRKADKGKIVDLLLKTSKLLEREKRVESVDFNPVIANGSNAWVVDAKITAE